MMDALFASSGLRVLENLQRAGFNMDVGSTPYDVIESIGTIKLLRYSKRVNKDLQPILIIPSLINRSYILDLLPEKSFIKFLSEHYSVYLLEWGEAQDEEKELTLENLLDLHLDYLLKTLRKDAQSEKVHIIGHCLGGNIGLIWSLLHPEQVASLSLLTTPLNFDCGGKLQAWAQHKSLDLASFVKAYGHAPWAMLQTAFLGLKPMQILQKYRKILPRLSDPKAIRNFMAMESWAADNRSVRGACYHDLIQLFYRQNCFFEKGFPFKGNRYLLADLQCPISAISATDDHIVPTEASLQQQWVPRAKSVKIWNSRGGHIGGLLGKASQEEIWPSFLKWIYAQEKTHDQQQKAI